MRMRDKAAVVTGAASGIGLAIASAFAREGARVAVADVDGDGAEAAVAHINKAGGQALAVAMDVTDEAEVGSGIDRVAEAFGGIDVLVSNAGVQHIESIADLSFADWRRVVAIHLDGAFLTTRAALRHMYASGRGGSIVYMGSVHSMLSSSFKAPYAAGKHGILGLARTVAKEGAAHGVRANVVCPGFVRTPLVERQIPELAEELGLSEEEVIKTVMLKDTVDGEFTTTDDVAEVAIFFASFPTNALTGQALVVSHGWYMD